MLVPMLRTEVEIRVRRRQACPIGQDPDPERADELQDDGGGRVRDAADDPTHARRQRRSGKDAADDRQEDCGRDRAAAALATLPSGRADLAPGTWS